MHETGWRQASYCFSGMERVAYSEANAGGPMHTSLSRISPVEVVSSVGSSSSRSRVNDGNNLSPESSDSRINR